MAVESFLKLAEAKLTIEKEAKPRPTTSELTTIESPGKPVPATSLEKSTKKKPKTTKKRAKSTSAEISELSGKKDSILIVTEKPQAAEKIANALSESNLRKYTDSNASYFEIEHQNKKIIVASAVGHLFNLTYEKGEVGWPVFKTTWEPAYTKKSAAFTKRYYNLLKKLTSRATEVIIATDYDAEGEVIGWNVLRFICKKQTAKRMKYSTLTKNELIQSYENPMPELDWAQAYAGETRHIADWLYGINLSRALMSAIKKTGSFKIMSIGRVQGPALKIIVDREKEINSFKSEPYWQVLAIVNDQAYKHPKDIFDKKELEQFKDIKQAEAETNEKQESLEPPAPFDLTTLQKESYGLHRISPSQTLAIAQKLYLAGVISYPRTSSQKIPESIEPKKILKELEKTFPKAKKALRKKPIEGLKSDPAHPSIYPTGEIPKNLEEQEEKLYNLIVNRFISCFSEDAQLLRKRTILKATKNPKLTFTASGLKILSPGWTDVYPAKLEEQAIQDLNGVVNVDEIKFDEKETQPPKRYTPASLITTLEKKNLGTKATRSSIVDILFDRGYLDGRSIKATALGLKLIEALEEYSPIIIDENLTRNLEEEMEKMQDNKDSPDKLKVQEDKIIEKVKKILTDISKEFKTKESEIGRELKKAIETNWQEEKENNTLITCPKCNEGQLRIIYSKKTKRYFVACSAYPKCTQTFSLPPDALIKKSDKICEDCKFPKLLSIKKAKRPWEFCFNPACPTNKERIEKYNAEKANKENSV